MAMTARRSTLTLADKYALAIDKGYSLPGRVDKPLTFRQFVTKVRPGYRWYRHCEILAAVMQDIVDGLRPRVMFLLPPRHGKSELASRLLPAYYLKRYPERWAGLNSYGSDLALTLSRASREHFIRGGGSVKSEASAVKHWETSANGGMWAAGVGGPITGKGFHLGIIDDAIKNDEEARSETIRAKHKEWYRSTFYTREEPAVDGMTASAIINIQCMVGHTNVLMADGSTKPLRYVKVGDRIATYADGAITTSEVLNWANQGRDSVFTIDVKSGISVTANARHPFLVDKGERLEWVRLRDLRPGYRLIRTNGTGASGGGSSAGSANATNPPSPRDIACPITIKQDGQTAIAPRQSTRIRDARRTYGTDTGLTPTNTINWSLSKVAVVPSVARRRERTCEPTGAGSSALTTTTKPARLGACCATIAISLSDTERRKPSCSPQLDTLAITRDEIVSITASGTEDVYDIQVAGTENFIADGFVSHNTRWHGDDLGGWLLSQELADDEPEHWHVVCFPAIATSIVPDYIPATCTVEPDWRKPGEALCPERYPIEKLLRIKSVIGNYHFAALYQQTPSVEDGEFFTTFPIVDSIPHGSTCCRAWDKAGSQGKGDWTAGVKIYETPDGRFIIADVVRGRWASDAREKAMRDTATTDGTECWVEIEQEGGSGGKQSGEISVKGLAGYVVNAEQVTGSKETRARPLSSQALGGNVYLLRGTWNKAFEKEAKEFPNGTHDDQIDAASLAFNKLALRPRPGIGIAVPSQPSPPIPMGFPGGIPYVGMR